MYLGIDCASKLNATTANNAKTAGYSFAGRYLVPEDYSKALTKVEAQAISNAGMRILSIWETTADRARSGAAAGAVDGQRALICARNIGIPTTGYIYFAVDYDAGDGDFPLIAEYLRAAKNAVAPYKIGVYGGYRRISDREYRLYVVVSKCHQRRRGQRDRKSSRGFYWRADGDV